MKKSEKVKIWQNTIKKLAKIRDNENVAIDKHALETIAAFNLNRIPTVTSCGGHSEPNKLRFPHVLGFANNKPKSRYGNDGAIRKMIARKHHTPQETIEINPGAAQEYQNIIRKNKLKENKTYKIWQGKNRQLKRYIQSLLDEFYQNHYAPMPARPYLSGPILGYLLNSGPLSSKYKLRKGNLKPNEIKTIQKQVRACKKEFKAFTLFLKKRFFTGKV